MNEADADYIFLEETDSTNTYAKKNFDAIEDGTLIVADKQTGGRGRLGRVWVSPGGVNIYASFVMKNCENPFGATQVLSLGALRMLRGLEGAGNLPLWIKWPNDIYCGSRKLAGVLCEAIPERGGVVAGIGINVNLSYSELEKISQPATSVLAATGVEYNLKKVITALDKSIKECYIMYNSRGIAVFEQWKAENFLIGQKVEIDSGKERYQAEVVDIADDGQLCIKRDSKIELLSCGDVSIVKDSIDFSGLCRKIGKNF